MNKNNIISIILVVGVIAAAVILIAALNRNRTAPETSNGGNSSTETGVAASSLDDMLNKQAPDFSLTDKEGKVYSLNSLKGKNILLFFNEGLMCYPACWDQILSLGQDKRFAENNTVALSVVIDTKEDWQNAISQMPELSQATILFDKGAVVSKEFGMLNMPSSMHYGRFPGHTYILIDKQGVVRHVYDDPNMANHNDKLMTEISKLN